MRDPIDLDVRLGTLGKLLALHRTLWAPRPFVERPVPSEVLHPAATAWLLALDDDEIDRIDTLSLGELAAVLPDPFGELAAAIADATRVPTVRSPGRLPNRWSWKTPQRKWRQIGAFLGAIGEPETTLIDWCAGKGHLGRTAALATGASVVALERDPTLCDSGRRLARRQRADLRFAEVDVWTPDARPAVETARGAIALHACGALHRRLIDLAIDSHETRSLAIAPCCYHVRPPDADLDARWSPESRAGRATGLRLTRHELKLAILDEVVAPPRERRHRRRELAWRAAWDCLRQKIDGHTGYRSPGFIARAEFRQPFPAFARRLARDRGLESPLLADDVRLCALARTGSERARQARALGIVRGLFRRAIEFFVVFDRAARLQDAGWHATVTTFCDRQLTPRNLLLCAHRGDR